MCVIHHSHFEKVISLNIVHTHGRDTTTRQKKWLQKTENVYKDTWNNHKGMKSPENDYMTQMITKRDIKQLQRDIKWPEWDAKPPKNNDKKS